MGALQFLPVAWTGGGNIKRLIHCILETAPARRKRLPPSAGRAYPLFLVAKNGLSAVVSQVTQAHLPLAIPQLMAYEKVVDWFFAQQTVIPMRYGCLFDSETQLVQSLDEREEEYRALLGRLAGCVEMGVRVILPERRGERSGVPALEPLPVAAVDATDPPATTDAPKPGHAYLAARHARDARAKVWAQEDAALLAQYRDGFAGLFRECRTEACHDRVWRTGETGALLSLYFLVPRAGGRAFCATFRRLSATGSARLLLSGPWPPYNFVIPGGTHGGEAEIRGGDKRDAWHSEASK